MKSGRRRASRRVDGREGEGEESGKCEAVLGVAGVGVSGEEGIFVVVVLVSTSVGIVRGEWEASWESIEESRDCSFRVESG